MKLYSLPDNTSAAIQWLSVPGIGQKTLWKIDVATKRLRMQWSETLQKAAILNQANVITTNQMLAVISSKSTLPSKSEICASLQKNNIWVITAKQSRFPQLLKESDSCPFLLFARGSKQVLTEIVSKNIPVVAVVGTRKITPYGRQVTTKIVQELVGFGSVIVSGGMYGVDSVAHSAAIEAGGKTICVLGSGILAIRAGWQQRLCQQIVQNQGLVVSQFYPWAAAQKGTFPVRNQVVAGLSNAVVVTEAAANSGSLITASCALDFGREVCAVSGSIFSPFNEGVEWLLNQGATLVHSGYQVMKTFQPQMSAISELKNLSEPPLSRAQEASSSTLLAINSEKIRSLLATTTSLTTEQISKHLNMSIQDTLIFLSQLELNGVLFSLGSNWHQAS